MWFFDPAETVDGEPYGPYRFHQIVQENYIISKNCHIPYRDVLKMTPVERQYILNFISDEIKRTNEEIERRKAESISRI